MESNLEKQAVQPIYNAPAKVIYFPLLCCEKNYQQEIHGILADDIPEEFLDIAEEIGMTAFFKLIHLCGGQNLYIPKQESIQRGSRDREIRACFNGGNYKNLAIQFRLSERQIRKIVAAGRSNSR